jgi:hypothetical protein
MKIIHDMPVGFTPREACKAFVPPLNEKRLREFLHSGELRSFMWGTRNYILRADLEDLIRKQPERMIEP